MNVTVWNISVGTTRKSLWLIISKHSKHALTSRNKWVYSKRKTTMLKLEYLSYILSILAKTQWTKNFSYFELANISMQISLNIFCYWPRFLLQYPWSRWGKKGSGGFEGLEGRKVAKATESAEKWRQRKCDHRQSGFSSLRKKILLAYCFILLV